VSEAREAPRRSSFPAAIAGGLIGAAATVAVLVFAVPELVAGRLVRTGMLADPEILVDAGNALRDRQYAPVLAQHRASIETPFGTSWKGASKPDVVLVEFYDYACPYCKASNPALDRLIKEDTGLRVVFRELPILGPDSVAAARLSLAASKAGRFAQFHDALWAAGKPGRETIAQAAAAAGIAPGAASNPEIEAELRKNFQLAGALGVRGTPVFVVGDRVLDSAVGYDKLKEAIADAREKG